MAYYFLIIQRYITDKCSKSRKFNRVGTVMQLRTEDSGNRERSKLLLLSELCEEGNLMSSYHGSLLFTSPLLASMLL
jgi:hypothetical protein